jgi:unsaturated chondroitin disaccharide hydrolase
MMDGRNLLALLGGGRSRTRPAAGWALGLAFAVCLAISPPVAAQESLEATVEADFAFAAERLARTADALSATAYPHQTTSGGSWSTTSASGWTSGFLPGALWLMYDRTRDAVWKARAERFQRGIEGQKTNTNDHDMWFRVGIPFSNGHRLTRDDAYRKVMVTAAGSLASRYSARVGMIRSWNHPDDFRVIVDNMLNLEVLFWAARNGGKPAWRDMAISHALRTSRDHVRADGSTFHVVNYDPSTGTLRSRRTHQGYRDWSTWSRGQAWAVYGFTMAYRETGDARFLETARRTADYFTARLPADKVPYWDFQAPNIPNEPRDSSASAVAASGLLELARLEPDGPRAALYRGRAREIINTLSTRAYLAKGTSNRAILLHGTRSKPAGDYDTGLIYGDYYFLAALLRLRPSSEAPAAAHTAVASRSVSP